MTQVTEVQTGRNNFTTTLISELCPSPQWAGDGYCDDDINSALCNFDDGDCCGDNRNVNYCTECICHSDDNADSSSTSPKFICYKPEWVGDGQCDDATNIAACNYDDGDCCGPNVQVNFCTSCTCFSDFLPNCIYPDWVGDGYCDDETNTASCEFDWEDCCWGSVSYCSECICYTDYTTTPKLNCYKPEWVGDGQCDDATNIAACNYDDGDCCGPDVKVNYCNSCICYSDFLPNCIYPDWVGDGYCNDETSTASCEFDWGDCCWGNMNYCSQCICHSDSTVSTQTIPIDDNNNE